MFRLLAEEWRQRWYVNCPEDTGGFRRDTEIGSLSALAAGEQPPALGGSGGFRRVRGAEKILAQDEDWRGLGTDADPTVTEVLPSLEKQWAARTASGGPT